MKVRIFVSVAAALAGGFVAGCGGGGGSKMASSSSGGVQFHVKWPVAAPASKSGVKPNLIPADTKSFVITIKDGATVVSGPIVITAPATSATVNNLPLKALTALVEAKASANGTGPAEAAASEMVTPTSGVPATAPTLTLQSQIVSLTIATPKLDLFVGGSAFLSVTPKDALGQVVLLDPAAATIHWNATPGVSYSSQTGLSINVTGTAEASGGSISATYHDGSAATGDLVNIVSNSVPLTVKKQPTGLPPNVEQYVNQAGLAIGPTGVGPGAFQSLNDVALGSLYTADPGNVGFEVQKYNQDKTTGALTLDTSFGNGGGVSVPNGRAVARASSDNVYAIGDGSTSGPFGILYEFTPTGTPVTLSNAEASVSGATGIVVDKLDNLIVAYSVPFTTPLSQVDVFNSSGTLVTSVQIAGSPAGITVDKNENIYLLVSNTIAKFKPNNAANLSAGYVLDTSFGNNGQTVPMVTPARIAVDTRTGVPTSGNLYVTLPQNNQVEVFDKNGVDDGKLPVDIPLSTPTGIAIDNSPTSVATSGYIYIGNQTIPGGSNVDKAVHVLKPAP